MSIKVKLLLWYCLVTLLILFIFSGAIYKTVEFNILKSIDTKLEAIGEDLIHDLEEYGKISKEKLKDEFDEIKIDPIYVRVLRKDLSSNESTVFVESENIDFSFPKESKEAFTLDEKRFITVKSHVVEKSVFTINVGTIVDKEESFEKEEETLDELFFALVIINPIILLISLVGGYFLINRLFAPIKDLQKDINNVTVSKLSLRLQEKKSKEINEIIRSFNSLLGRLEESFIKISQFGSNASHELKTPLTVMRGEMEIALRKTRSLDEYKSVLTSSLEEIDQIQKIIDELLFLSKSDNNKLDESFENEYIDEVLIDCVEELKTYSLKKGASLKVVNIEPFELEVNKNLLKTAIKNILKNALEYGGEGSIVEVSLENEEIIIQDNGVGISQKHLKKIFDRFYRVDKARTSKSSGSGLGLSIVKAIMDLHKGEVLLDSRENLGTKVTLILKKK